MKETRQKRGLGWRRGAVPEGWGEVLQPDLRLSGKCAAGRGNCKCESPEVSSRSQHSGKRAQREGGGRGRGSGGASHPEGRSLWPTSFKTLWDWETLAGAQQRNDGRALMMLEKHHSGCWTENRVRGQEVESGGYQKDQVRWIEAWVRGTAGGDATWPGSGTIWKVELTEFANRK